MHQINRFSFLLFFWFICLSADAQTIKAFVKAGDESFEEEDYYAASQHYKQALAIKREQLDIQYKYAQANQRRKAFRTAEKAYRYIAGKPTESMQFPRLFFELGQVRKQQGKYRYAKKDFEKYLKLNPDTLTLLSARAKKEIQACDWAMKAMENPVQVEITLPKEPINSPYSEFAPFPLGDSLWYGALKFEGSSEEMPKVARPVLFDGLKSVRLNGYASGDQHTGHMSFNDSLLVFTRCESITASSIRCDLYYRQKESENWSAPRKIKAPSTFDGFSLTQVQIGSHPENPNKTMLYFSSDCDSGKGGYDIWMANLQAGTLMNPVNLETLNTEADEFSPVFHEENQQIWWSSQGREGFGGQDIFYANWTNQAWTKPQNAGFPINSSYDDLYFYLDHDQKKAWWTSNREGAQSLTKDEACCHDIFIGTFEEPFNPNIPIDEPEDPIVITPIPIDTNLLALNPMDSVDIPDDEISISPIPVDTISRPELTAQLLLPIPLYFHNDEPDSNSYSLITRLDYPSTYDYYQSLKPKYVEQFSLGDENLALEVESFFEDEVSLQYLKLDPFAQALLEALQTGESFELGIRGFTSPRAPNDYNDRLANRRIVSVILFFENFQDGAFQTYIQSGKLQFNRLPFGESQAPETVNDDYRNPRYSIYSVDASRERRVEIEFLKELN